MFTIADIIWVIAVIAAWSFGQWIAGKLFAWIDKQHTRHTHHTRTHEMSNTQQSQAALAATTALLAKSNERLAAAVHALQSIACASITEDSIDPQCLAVTTLHSIGVEVTLPNPSLALLMLYTKNEVERMLKHD